MPTPQTHEYYPTMPATPISLYYKPRSDEQIEAQTLWPNSRIMFFIGAAGTGKTASALGMALRETLQTPNSRILLARPTVGCDEDNGFLPGDLIAKLMPWMGAFRDCLGNLSNDDLEGVIRKLGDRIEITGLGMLRGRTIMRGTLICDEVQNCTFNQLHCITTRLGDPGGRVILCGDPAQSDRFGKRKSPLAAVAKHLSRIPSVETIRFKTQLRSPIVTLINNSMDALKGGQQ